MIAETNKFENKYFSQKERKGKKNIESDNPPPLRSRFCSLEKKKKKKKKTECRKKMFPVPSRITSSHVASSLTMVPETPILAYHRCLHGHYMPDSLVFDISHISHMIDISRVRFLSAIYKRMLEASVEIARMRIFKAAIFFLFLDTLLHLTFVSLSFALILFRSSLSNVQLNDWYRSVFQQQRYNGVSRVSTSGIYFFLRARALSAKEKLCSPLALPVPLTQGHLSITLSSSPPLYIHYSCRLVASSSFSFSLYLFRCLSFSVSRCYGWLNGKNETYKTPRQRKILSYRTKTPRINPRSQMRR